jgi:hypothetical protein
MNDANKPAATEEKKAGLSAPWWTTYKKIKAIFEKDPEIEVSDLVEGENGQNFVTLTSANKAKLEAIASLVKDEFKYGNVTLTVQYYYSGSEEVDLSTFDTAFKGNPIYVRSYDAGMGFFYAIFAKEIIQFYNDDLTDAYGNYNAVAADVVSDILVDGISINPSTLDEANTTKLVKKEEDK